MLFPKIKKKAMYHISKYNFYIDTGTSYYIYNTISNKYQQFPFEVYKAILEADHAAEVIKDEESISIFPKDVCGRFTSDLKLLRIIYDEVQPEYEYLKYAHDRDILNTEYSSLIILPNLSCNLNCHYCYEKDKNISMSATQESSLTKFLLKESKNKKWLNIRWSGGEPLLLWNRIKRISERVIAECSNNNCNYAASIITNGTLLDKERVVELTNCSIKSAQITLDGDSKTHNKIRFFRANGVGTFERILENICYASQKLKIHLRINVDKDNLNRMPHLFDEIASSEINRKNVQLFCRPVMCTLARTPHTQLFSPSEFLEVEKALLELARERNLQYSFHRGMGNKSFRCCMNAIEGYYISPELHLYKCPMYIDYDAQHAVGHITEDGDIKITNLNEFTKGFQKSPFDANSKCKKCKVLPLCNGECIMQHELSPTDPLAGCIPEKKSILKKIKYAIENPIESNAFSRSSFLEL
jgi:uncharacterized protein